MSSDTLMEFLTKLDSLNLPLSLNCSISTEKETAKTHLSNTCSDVETTSGTSNVVTLLKKPSMFCLQCLSMDKLQVTSGVDLASAQALVNSAYSLLEDFASTGFKKDKGVETFDEAKEFINLSLKAKDFNAKYGNGVYAERIKRWFEDQGLTYLLKADLVDLATILVVPNFYDECINYLLEQTVDFTLPPNFPANIWDELKEQTLSEIKSNPEVIVYALNPAETYSDTKALDAQANYIGNTVLAGIPGGWLTYLLLENVVFYAIDNAKTNPVWVLPSALEGLLRKVSLLDDDTNAFSGARRLSFIGSKWTKAPVNPGEEFLVTLDTLMTQFVKQGYSPEGAFQEAYRSALALS